MIIEKAAAKKTLSLALALALFAGSPLSALAQVVRAPVVTGVPGGLGVAGTLGAISAPSSMGVLTIPNLTLGTPTIEASAAAPVINAFAQPVALAQPVLAAPAIAGRAVIVPAAISVQAVPLESLPAGINAAMSPFAKALAAKENAAPPVGHVFDASRKFAAQEGDEVSAEGAEGGEEGGVTGEAAALHKAWETKSAARVEAFEAEVAKVQSGRIGLKIAYQINEGKLAYGVGYKLDGKLMDPRKQRETLIAAGVSPAEWNAAKTAIDAAVPALVKKLVAMLQQNENEHGAVHEKMNALAKSATLKAMTETMKQGTDLQAWGVPISISINQKTGMRYARTYRLNGMPTDFGAALHDLIAPLMAADPKFLSKVTNAQLHEAAQYLSDSLKYGLDEGTPDGMKKIRLSGGRSGYDYPEQRKALVDLARRKLTQTPLPGDALAGLTATPESLQPAAVMKNVLTDLMKTFGAYSQDPNATPEETQRQFNLLADMHAAIGRPVQTGQGMQMLPITHRALKPVLEELARRGTPAEVVTAVIRAFPLGESLLRLGVADLWAKGVTGKGIKVAVIDNGVDFGHPDMADIQNPVVENFTRDRGAHTKGGHGTPMASIIHAIAPDADIQSYQALPNTDGLVGVALSQEETVQAVLKAMDRAAANGVNIISMSLGFPMSYANDPVAIKASELIKKGIVVIVSAGNEGDSLPKGMQIRSPASSPDVIAVGAVDYHGKIAPFSSEGFVMDPSNGTANEKPDIYAPGVNIKAAMLLPAQMYPHEPVPYNHASGTSPAAPHVSGVAALMLGAALAAGSDLAGAAIPVAVREALAAGVTRIERLPVLTDAAKAVKTLIDILKPIA
jgi:subtilisin family serine protease